MSKNANVDNVTEVIEKSPVDNMATRKSQEILDQYENESSVVTRKGRPSTKSIDHLFNKSNPVLDKINKANEAAYNFKKEQEDKPEIEAEKQEVSNDEEDLNVKNDLAQQYNQLYFENQALQQQILEIKNKFAELENNKENANVKNTPTIADILKNSLGETYSEDEINSIQEAIQLAADQAREKDREELRKREKEKQEIEAREDLAAKKYRTVLINKDRYIKRYNELQSDPNFNKWIQKDDTNTLWFYVKDWNTSRSIRDIDIATRRIAEIVKNYDEELNKKNSKLKEDARPALNANPQLERPKVDNARYLDHNQIRKILIYGTAEEKEALDKALNGTFPNGYNKQAYNGN